jgi:membrane-associated HD superfamily phosphohydrolase
VAITRDVEKMTRTARQITDAQGDSYEALADNFAALQRRNVKLAQEGIEFLRLQHSNARAAQEWWTDGLKLTELQQRNIKFAQEWLTDGIEVLRAQAEHNGRTAEVFVESAREQQEGLGRLAEEWVEAYRDVLDIYQDFFFSPFSYAQEALRGVQQATQQGLQTTRQVTQQGVRLVEEATEQTEQAIRQAEQAIEEADLQAAVLSALKTQDYEELTVAEISKKLEGLSIEDLKKVREYEKRTKNRETLIEQLDRKIKAKS